LKENMMIVLNNGSKIKTIDTKEESKRGYIKGRRLTDKEYRQMIDNEIYQTECNLRKF